jgi:hydroxymethylpyrimidine/phosphomethylpyrimidine kinase
VALSVAGSDSGGGAGIQADLLTFWRMGVFGTTAITCATAQNLKGVSGVAPLAPGDVQLQIEAVLDGFHVGAAKTGMLYSREIIERLSRIVSRPGFPPLVVDPVMVATSGGRLLQDDAVEAYVDLLFPWAAVATPNLDEAAVLLGRRVRSAEEMPDHARDLAEKIRCPVFLKGGHLEGPPVDVLWDGRRIHRWEGERVEGLIPHGTGCILSAAVAARLAFGDDLAAACRAARDHVAWVLRHPVELPTGTRVPGLGRYPA